MACAQTNCVSRADPLGAAADSATGQSETLALRSGGLAGRVPVSHVRNSVCTSARRDGARPTSVVCAFSMLFLDTSPVRIIAASMLNFRLHADDFSCDFSAWRHSTRLFRDCVRGLFHAVSTCATRGTETADSSIWRPRGFAGSAADPAPLPEMREAARFSRAVAVRRATAPVAGALDARVRMLQAGGRDVGSLSLGWPLAVDEVCPRRSSRTLRDGKPLCPQLTRAF